MSKYKRVTFYTSEENRALLDSIALNAGVTKMALMFPAGFDQRIMKMKHLPTRSWTGKIGTDATDRREVCFKVKPDVFESLTSVARQRGCPVNIVLQALFDAVVAKHSTKRAA